MKKKRITTYEAGEIIGSSAQFVRAAMQQGKLPIGVAIKMPNSPTWTYNISEKLLAEYTGKDIEKELEVIRGNA